MEVVNNMIVHRISFKGALKPACWKELHLFNCGVSLSLICKTDIEKFMFMHICSKEQQHITKLSVIMTSEN